MHSTTLCALTVALTLISVDQCQGKACYECNAATEDDCIKDKTTLRICGSDSLYYLWEFYDAPLTEMLQTFNKKQALYENKDGYIDIYKQLNMYIKDIKESLDLKLPTPYYADDLSYINGRRKDTYKKYAPILKQWNKEELAKYEQYWIDVVMPQLDTLKAAWKGKVDMPDPPDWREGQFPGMLIEFDEYKEIIDEWLADAHATVKEGKFKDYFHEAHRHKWRKKIIDNNAKGIGKREVPPNDRPIIREIRTNRATALLADLPIDETWCAKFTSPSLGVQRGCGVQLKGFVFEYGCHKMSAPYEGITYCRCNDSSYYKCDERDPSSSGVTSPGILPPGMILPPGILPPGMILPPGILPPDILPPDTTPPEIPPEPIYSDSARRYPSLLLIVITLYVTLTA